MSRCGTQFAISIDELKEIANGHILAIAQHLLPNGRENCGFWETSSIADLHTGKYSLKVNLRGATRGLWTDFAAPKGSRDYSGNVIQLVAQVKFGGDVGRACQWLRSWLGLDHLDPDRLATEKAKAARRAEQAETDATAKAEKNRRRAHHLFLSATHYPGTIVERYLCSRGLDLRVRDLHAPGAIRFHPEVYCAETGTKLPAMIAPIVALDGRHLGTHRTWLQPDGSGKATLVEAKKSIGKYQGGHIPLWKGKHRVPLREIPAGTAVYISEGIEDGLSIALAKPELRVIAGVSLSNIGSLELPDDCPVYLLAQRDEKMKALEAFETALARLQERGYAVFLVYPPEGFKDYNDALCGTPRAVASGGNNGERQG